jgi:hypothetical protein
MKCSGEPFTHICEWKRHSPSSGSLGSLGWTMVVVMVVLRSTSMICFPLSGSNSELEPASDFEVFNSATNNCFERHSSMLFQVLLWNSHHFPVYLFVFPLPFFVGGLDRLSCGGLSLLYFFFCGLGLPFPCFCCEEFADPNSRFFYLNFFLILTTYL